VRGTGYDVDHLDQPRVSLSLSADMYLSVLIHSYGRMCLRARSVKMGTYGWRFVRNGSPARGCRRQQLDGGPAGAVVA
jgi:hypothetical protein